MTQTRRLAVLAAAGACALAAGLSACGSSSNATPKGSGAAPSTTAPPAPTPLSISVDAKGGLSALAPTMPAGTYEITATPASATLDYGVQLVRVAPGYSKAQLLSDVGSGFMGDKPDAAAVKRLYSQATFVGGPSGTGTQRAVTYLPAGSYYYTNTDTQGAPVLQAFTVTAGASAPALPTTPVTVTGSGDAKGMYMWNVDGSLGTSGMLTFKNASQDNAHFLLIAKIKPGKTATDCENYNGDPGDPGSPCTSVVEASIVSPGSAEAISFTSQGPGTYLLLCYLPDPATGQPHATEGMSKQVTVE